MLLLSLQIVQALKMVIMNYCKRSDSNVINSKLSSLKNELEWMTTEQVADYLQTSNGYIRNLTSNGRIPYHKFGRKNLYLKSDLDNLILQNKKGGYQWQ